jgi:hypothetical protein
MNTQTEILSPPAFLDTTELLILADGRILVHNLTPEVALMLTQCVGTLSGDASPPVPVPGEGAASRCHSFTS